MSRETILIVTKLIETGVQRYGSASAFARAIGMSRAALSKRKQGYTSVKLEEGVAWARLLGVSLDELAGVTTASAGAAETVAVKESAGRELARLLFERMQSAAGIDELAASSWAEPANGSAVAFSDETASIVARIKAQLVMLRAGEALVKQEQDSALTGSGH